MARKKKKAETEAEIVKELNKLQVEYELDVIDRQILTLISQDIMLTSRTIAEKIGMSYTAVSKRMKKRGFVLAYENLTQTTAQIMEANAKKAARRLGKLIEDDEKKIALEATKLALSPYLNQHHHTVTQANVMVYKTTVQPDGSLLQSVIEAEHCEIKEPSLQSDT